MSESVSIALAGDHDPAVTPHRAIPLALKLSGEAIDCAVRFDWIGTDLLAGNTEQWLEPYHAVWCVPNSPYRSMEGALEAIRFARERQRPFLGTCGGFQHAIIEYARNVLALPEADHAESNPTAELLIIAPLACSLAEGEETVDLVPGSKLAGIYGRNQVLERYNCNYGLNPAYQDFLRGETRGLTEGNRGLFGKSGVIRQPMRLAAVGARNEVRAIELEHHPFFIATLFQPERSALGSRSHPLISAFIRAAATGPA